MRLSPRSAHAKREGMGVTGRPPRRGVSASAYGGGREAPPHDPYPYYESRYQVE